MNLPAFITTWKAGPVQQGDQMSPARKEQLACVPQSPSPRTINGYPDREYRFLPCLGSVGYDELPYHFLPKSDIYYRQLTPSQQAGDAILNPKVTMIIHQCFPLIIERHEKDPISEEASIGSLERYRKMGYDAIRNLPETERERDRKEIDTAYQESVEKIQKTADRKKLQPPVPESDDESKGT